MAGDVPEWGFKEEGSAEWFSVDPEDPSTALGAGAFGAVFAASFHGIPAAAKTLHALQQPMMYQLVGPNADPAAVRQVLAEFNSEAESLAAVRHPNVLRFFGVCFAQAAQGEE